ncbi:MAG: methyltransferase family protein [Promethearchaeota archaeon]
MSGEESSLAEVKELRNATITYIVRTIVGITLMGLIFFLSAGRINIPQGWLMLGIYFCFAIIQIFIFHKLNPDLLIARMKRRVGPYKWDKVFIALFGLCMYGLFAVFGLDVGRFQWSSLGFPFLIIGFIVFGFSGVLATWAMVVNRHFENIVRIQSDRNHQVITNGPYSIIRHPGYLASFLNFLALPFIIGSAFGLILIAFFGVLFVARTSLEDKTLQQELEGYKDYAKKVKYKFIPFIW